MQQTLHTPTFKEPTNTLHQLITYLVTLNHHPPNLIEMILKQPSINAHRTPNSKKQQTKYNSDTQEYKKLLLKQFLSNDQTTYDDSQELIVSFGKDFGSQGSKNNWEGLEHQNAHYQASLNQQKSTDKQFKKIDLSHKKSILSNNNNTHKSSSNKVNKEINIKTIDLSHYNHNNQSQIQSKPIFTKNSNYKVSKCLQNYHSKINSKLNFTHKTFKSPQMSPTSKQYLSVHDSRSSHHKSNKQQEQKASEQILREKKLEKPCLLSPSTDKKKITQSPCRYIKKTKEQSPFKSPPLNKSFAKGIVKSPIKSPNKPISISISLPPIPPQTEIDNKEKDLIKEISNDIRGLIKKLENEALQQQKQKEMIKFEQNREWKN